MENGELTRGWHRLRRYRTIGFVILFAVSAVICLFALRHNYSHMVALRDQVYTADKAGSGVEPALQALQTYVTNHMNTSLTAGPDAVNPPIQLKYTYDRARESAIQPSDQSSFYTEAQDYCQTKYPVESSLFVWQSYVACVQSYLSDHNVNVTAPISSVPASLYKFDFASPAWSPDLAGWSLVATALFLVLAAVFGLIDWHHRRQFKGRQ